MKANQNQTSKTSSLLKRAFTSSLLLAAATLPNFGQSKDLLEGNGRFDSQTQIDAWTKVTAGWYNYEIINNDYMKYQKLEKAEVEGFFDDGMFYFLNGGQASTPKHITFEVLTTNNQIEVCDLRLTTLGTAPPVDPNAAAADAASNSDPAVDPNIPQQPVQPPVTSSPKGPAGYERVPNTDVVFFRLGYYNFMKVNTESMIHKTENNEWLKVDILIHWEEQNVSVWVGNEPMPATGPAPQAFFVDRKKRAESANAIGLYSLTPGGICHIKNLQVCDTDCQGKNETIMQIKGAVGLATASAIATSAALAHLFF